MLAFAYQPDQLRIAVLRSEKSESHDPYPTIWRELARALESATSIETDPLVKEIIRPEPAALKRHALAFWMIGKPLTRFGDEERRVLANWVKLGGGMIVAVRADNAPQPSAGQDDLDERARREIESIFEGSKLEVIPSSHAVFRSFYLVNQVGGTFQRARSLEGIRVGERYGLILSRNDLLGALLRDAQGRYLFGCYPGGENQRKETFKLVVNLFLYALTGTYKEDIIHSPFIEQKLKWKIR